VSPAIITTTVDRAADLTVQVTRGPVTADEIEATIVAFYAGEVTRKILWDFREASFEQMTGEHVRGLVLLTQRFSHLRPGGRTAMLFSSTLGFGLGRMFEGIRKATDGADLEHASFTSLDEAMAWLDQR
jgi:hypothetical protein